MNTEDVAVEFTDNVSRIKDNTITLSTGVKLNAKQVPMMVISDITRKYKKPTPPIAVNQDKGRQEENLSDPRYLESVAQWESDVTNSMMDAMILMGTSINLIPKGFSKPEDVDWSEDLELINIEIGTNPKKRYLMWVKYKAAPSNEDMTNIIGTVSKLSGVSEEDVTVAADSFRDKAE